MINNSWTTEIVNKLAISGYIHSKARYGFIDRGRGAISLDCQSPECYGGDYLSRAAWQLVNLDDERMITLNKAIDEYRPMSEAVIVVVSPLDSDRAEITTYLVTLSTYNVTT